MRLGVTVLDGSLLCVLGFGDNLFLFSRVGLGSGACFDELDEENLGPRMAVDREY